MSNTEVIEKVSEDIEVSIPKMYKVVLYNDDKTTVEFVISVLTQIFYKTFDEALQITISVHNSGRGIAGAPYTKEIAEEKTIETIGYARENGFPLRVSFEEME